MPVLRNWELPVDADQVLWGQGADPAVVRARRPRLVQWAEDAIGAGLPFLAPAVLFDRFAIEGVSDERVMLTGGGSLSGPLITEHFRNAEHIAVAICTVGEDLLRYAGEVSQTDPVRALALSGLASAATQVLAQAACGMFDSEARQEGKIAGIAISPGMIGWPLQEGQGEVFSLLPAHDIGVRLDPSGIMTPLKSLSFVVGYRKQSEHGKRGCDRCTMYVGCQFRES